MCIRDSNESVKGIANDLIEFSKSSSKNNPKINAINIGTDIAIKVIPIIRPITSLRKLNPHYFFKGRYFF